MFAARDHSLALTSFLPSLCIHRWRPLGSLGMTSVPLASSAPGEQARQFHARLGFTPLPQAWPVSISASRAPRGTTAAVLGYPTSWRPRSVTQGERWPEEGRGSLA